MKVFAFEELGEDLKLLPLSARRALDVAGRKLSLAAWQKMATGVRRELAHIGSAEVVNRERVRELIVGADPAASEIECDDEVRLTVLPDGLPVDAEGWAQLSRLERFALLHAVERPRGDRLKRACDEIMTQRITHLNARGEARMVDVGRKEATHRRAVAAARVRMKPETSRRIADASKGDVLATARLAGIMAAKQTPSLIPLCHHIALTKVEVDLEVQRDGVAIRASAEAVDRTGVEMEAMVAASVAALTVYDMLKAVERGMVIEQVVLLEKSGGRSGHYQNDATRGEHGGDSK